MGKKSLLSFTQLPAKRVVARVGLISDTHMPERCAAFPPSLFDVLQGVDLLLHAGDVGELWVLERLSAIAPVVAVHGNDDTEDAQRELPYQQLVSIAGQRILLWHSHYPDPAEDKAKRAGPWQWIWTRQAEWARRVEADVVVFGHAHVPMSYPYQNVMLVNPGALASGSLFTRQERKTVALLFIHDDGTSSVTHVDLAVPDRVYVPNHDWEAGFEVALEAFQSPIVEQDLLEDVAKLREQTYRDLGALKEAILPLCHPCWTGERRYITRAELLSEIEHSTEIAPKDKEKVVAILSGRAS
jgi:putative phosphoesterase